MRKLVTIRTIEEVKPIAGADKICAYRVGGWWVVDQIDKYKIGDKAVYFEIDSWVPNAIAPFLAKDGAIREFNGVQGDRVRTIKLRGQYSQGLLMDLDILNSIDLYSVEEGDDLAELLGVQKWEPPDNTNGTGNPVGSWPSRLKHTDQERAQNLNREIFIDNKDAHYEVTMKLDGSSMSVFVDGENAGVCSRKINLKLDNENNRFINMERKYNIINRLRAIGCNLAIQGELMGPGIQGNKEQLKEHDLYVFDIWDLDAQQYLSPQQRAATLLVDFNDGGRELPTVPLLYWNVTLADLGIKNMEELIAFADGPSLNGKYREGLVFKRMDGQFSWKIISNKFLSKEKDF